MHVLSTPAIALRPACVPDAITVAALSVQVFLDTYAIDGIRPDLAEEAFEMYSAQAFACRIAEPNHVFILAESGAGLLGYAEVLLSSVASPAQQLSGAELIRLYVQPRFQHMGIGRLLLERTEHETRAAKVPAIWLTAWDGNANARAFYARMGYADVGATTYSIKGNTYANRVIAKHLLDTKARPGNLPW